MRAQTGGATVGHLNVEDIRNLDVAPMPTSSAHQARSADLLGSIDDLIENNRRRVEVLGEIARAIYREWFVKFRYPGHQDVPLVDSALGAIPEGWTAGTIGDVLELKYGKALKADARRGGDVAVVSSAGVVGWHDESIVDGPAIVVGRKGNVGSVHWVDGPAGPSTRRTTLRPTCLSGSSSSSCAALSSPTLTLPFLVSAVKVPTHGPSSSQGPACWTLPVGRRPVGRRSLCALKAE